MKKKEDKIEKIYIIKNEEDKINRVLIQHTDENFSSYIQVPDNYSKLSTYQKEKLEKEYKRCLISIFKTLSDKENKIIFVNPDEKELIEYVDTNIKYIKEKRQKSIQKINEKTEFGYILFSGIFTICSFHSLGFLFRSFVFNILGSNYSVLAIINHNKQKITEEENKFIKTLKLYLSYLLLSLNIGLGVNKLSVNWEYFIDAYDFVSLSTIQTMRFKNTENPFSNNMMTTQNAATELLLNALDLNPLVEEKDLEIALSLENYLNHNPYLNYEKIYDDFLKTTIIHSKRDKDYVAGENYRRYKTIILYDNEKMDEESYINSLFHELVHYTGDLDNRCLDEGMTAIISREFDSSNHQDGYAREVGLCKVLCEFVGPDRMLKAYSTSDISVVEDGLYEIIPDKDFNTDFLNLLNSFSADSYEISNQKGNEKITKILTYIDEYLKSDKLTEEQKEYISYHIIYI